MNQPYLFLLAVVAMFGTSQVAAQSLDCLHSESPYSIETPSKESKLKAGYEGWKEAGEAFNASYAALNRELSFMFQDSNALWVSDAGSAGVGLYYMGSGSAFDPMDIIYELYGDNIALSRFNSYVVDSVRFRYAYVRYVDSVDLGGGLEEVVDTLVFQFFTKEQLELGVISSNSNIYARPASYSVETGASDLFEYEVHIPLRLEHATDTPSGGFWGVNVLTVPLPDILIPDNSAGDGSNVCGWFVTFKTMLPFAAGDTIEAPDEVEVKKRLNYFAISNYHNHGSTIVHSEYYSNSFWTNKMMRDGGEWLGFTGFLPGYVYAAARYIRYGIHIKTDNLAVHEHTSQLEVAVYPNPVKKDQTLAVQFESGASQGARFEVYDPLGRAVLAQEWELPVPGGQRFELDLGDWRAGLYSYKLETSEGSSTGWIQIVE